MVKRIIYDIDNTLALNTVGVSYGKKLKNPLLNVEHLSCLSRDEIFYYTARNMLSLDENLDDIRSKMVPVLEQWLKENQLPTNKIYIGKPFCGNKGIYVDDRAINLNNHKLSLTSGLINTKICIVMALFNAMENVHDIILELIEISTMCPELIVIMVDNGSKDGTGEFISVISGAYPFIKSVKIHKNIGYGGAIKEGILEMRRLCPSDEYSLILSHGNFKYSILDFVKGICKARCMNKVCFTRRLNRSLLENVLSYVLHFIFATFRGLPVRDCLGASRYIPAPTMRTLTFNLAPDDYLFDMWLALSLKKNDFIEIPIVQMTHKTHQSSWNGRPFAKLRMISKYMAYFFRGN
jgi:capsule biosynthesis phosphatase